MLTLWFVVSLSRLVAADIAGDCKQLTAAFQIPANDSSRFQAWCQKVVKACYKIDDDAADACGASGPQSTQINSMMNNVTQLKTDSTITRSDAGLNACTQTNLLRQNQISKCSDAKDQCNAKKETFETTQPRKTVSLACVQVTTESKLWSAEAKSAGNICKTISADLLKVKGSLISERMACSNISTQAEAYSGQTRDQRQSPGGTVDRADARACGIAGCTQQPDGSYTKNTIAQPASYPTPSPTPSSASSPAWAQEPQVNKSITLTYPDARACGLFGCHPDGHGGYNPIVK